MQFGAEHDVHLQLSLAFFSTDVYSAGFAFYFPYFASKSHLASVASRLSGGCVVGSAELVLQRSVFEVEPPHLISSVR